MRLALAWLVAVPLLAQQAAQTPAQQPAAEPPPSPTPAASPTPATSPTAAAPPEPAPAAETWITGSLDLGYRFTSVGGDNEVYRSVVNLGQGPRLLGLDFTIVDPKKRLFDRLDVRANNWGGDPYNTVHVNASKLGIYDFNFDYRDIAYFNMLPSFADPLFGTGIVLDEDSYFSRRRMSDFQLDLLPGHRIIPYLAYGRDSGEGTGITTFVSDVNEYPVADQAFDKTDNFRGGIRLEFNNFHVTLEQGGTTLRDNQQAYDSTVNYGNNYQPYFGQTLDLTNLAQAYGIRGSSVYTRVLFTANPHSWLDLYGQFLYSQADTSVNYTQFDTGNLVLESAILFYTGEQALGFAEGKQPHTAGSLGFELRPVKRVRILGSWMTDRMHTAAAGLVTDMILQPLSLAQTTLMTLDSLLSVNYNQEEVDVLLDATRKLTLRGGYRYVWGDAQTGSMLIAGPGQESSDLRQQIGIAGATFRATQKLSLNVDFEGAVSDHAYFRTSLYNYQKMRARARYQVAHTLALQASFSLLNNQNPTAGINYNFLSRQNSVSAVWTPSKRVSILGEYTRSTLYSNIGYLEPEYLSPETSLYRDNAHNASALVDLALPGYAKLAPYLAFGGSLFLSSGSRPTTYYQPLARLSLPLHKGLVWKSEYRYYGYGETFYEYEGFRAHILQTGLTISR
jgi:hypothetical protein